MDKQRSNQDIQWCDLTYLQTECSVWYIQTKSLHIGPSWRHPTGLSQRANTLCKPVHPYPANKVTYLRHMCIPAKAQTCVSTHQRNQRDIFKVMKKKSSSSHVTMPKFQEEGDHFPQWAQSFNPAFRQQSQQWTVNIARRDGVWYYLRKAK